MAAWTQPFEEDPRLIDIEDIMEDIDDIDSADGAEGTATIDEMDQALDSLLNMDELPPTQPSDTKAKVANTANAAELPQLVRRYGFRFDIVARMLGLDTHACRQLWAQFDQLERSQRARAWLSASILAHRSQVYSGTQA